MALVSKDVLVARLCGVTLHVHVVRSEGLIWAEGVDEATGRTVVTLDISDDYYLSDDLDCLDEAHRKLKVLPPRRVLGSGLYSKGR